MSPPADASEFDVIVHPLDDGGYWAEVEGLPGCLTQASSYTEILARIRDAHETCLNAQPPALSAEANGFKPSALKDIRTAGALAEALSAAGWQRAARGTFHDIYATFGRAERISVLTDPDSILNEGYLKALAKLLS